MDSTSGSTQASTSKAVDGLNTILVIGGEGFLGHCLLRDLYKRYGASVRLYSSSRTRRFHEEHWDWVQTDVTSRTSIDSVLSSTGAKTVFLAATSHFDSAKAAAWKVNVAGTQAVVDACLAAGVRRLIYTSSTAAIFSGKNVIDATEEHPTVSEDDARSVYGASKAVGERIVMQANGENGMFTCAIRPASFTGPGDTTVIPQGLAVMKQGQAVFQVGDNSALCDWDHVDNVTYGHILAYEKLLSPSDPNQPGPAAGEIFNITGCDPWPLWTYFQRMWFLYNGYQQPFKIVIPYWLAYAIAVITVFFQDLFGLKRGGMTPHTVIYATAWRTHNCDKAKRLIGYEPVINTEEGLQQAVQWYKEEEKKMLLEQQTGKAK